MSTEEEQVEIMAYDNKVEEIYNEGFKDGYQDGYHKGFSECRNREYHTGYKHGYRDSCEDRYWTGWYSGLMVGTVSVLIGGIMMYTTTKKNRFPQF